MTGHAASFFLGQKIKKNHKKWKSEKKREKKSIIENE